MKAAGFAALALGLILAVPLLLAAGYETVAAVRAPGPDTALLQFDMTAPSEWNAATFVRDSLEPFSVGLEVARTSPPGGWNDPPGGKGTLEVEIKDPAGAVAFLQEVEVDAVGPMGGLMTTGITTVQPKKEGRWTIRGRVLRADPTFAGSIADVSIGRRSRMESGHPVRNVILASGGLAGAARPVVLLLAGASLLIGSRRR